MKKRFLGTMMLSGLLLVSGAAVAQDTNTQYPQTPVDPNATQQQPTQNPNYPNQYPNQNQTYPQTPVSGQTGTYMQGVSLPAGTEISVRANQKIDSKEAQPGQTFDAEIESNVIDANGNMVIPKGAMAQLALVNAGKSALGKDELGLALQSVNINGQTRMLQTNTVEGGKNNGGIGANKRTGVYVGSGALIGTVIGAMAGGGKGAAIGAILGAAGGAGTQVLTRGSQVNVPAETVLKFKLDQPVILQ